MYYSILVRWGTELDSQSVIYTRSKALFEALKRGDNIFYDRGFSDELKQDIVDAHNRMDWAMPNAPEPLDENMCLIDAIEYLQDFRVPYPITVLDHTEFTPYWNY